MVRNNPAMARFRAARASMLTDDDAVAIFEGPTDEGMPSAARDARRAVRRIAPRGQQCIDRQVAEFGVPPPGHVVCPVAALWPA